MASVVPAMVKIGATKASVLVELTAPAIAILAPSLSETVPAPIVPAKLEPVLPPASESLV